ncbi:unnamed protein product, partial [Rotaria sp. Silwood1]
SYSSIAGGYTNRPELIKDKYVQGLTSYAAEYLATKENLFLNHLKVTGVQTQVVAGLNYKIDFSGKSVDGSSGQLKTCQAIIYVRLDHTQQVTSVKCH